MYPEFMIAPMREELTRLGIKEARTPSEVDSAVVAPGSTMVIVNSVCGCAAGRMRPAVRMALQHGTKPDHMISVFAGQDQEATQQARSYFRGYPPSSPSIGLLRDGHLVYLMQRSDIEHREAVDIAGELKGAFDKFCGKPAGSPQSLGASHS
jgi:putative YphP/YqiW family bacilliredoxin